MYIQASKIYSWMPQRYPMLLVDRVATLEAGVKVHAQKAISLNDYFYHSLPSAPEPEDFAYPHGLLIEALAQAAGILLRDSWPQLRSDKHMVMFGSFSGVTIYDCAYPGDLLDLEANLEVATEDAAVISGCVVCNSKTLIKVKRISAALRPSSLFSKELM